MSETFRRRDHGNYHSYWLGDRKVPGVTTIINAGYNKQALIGWAGSAVAEYVVDRLEQRDGHILADSLIDDVRAGAKYPLPPGLPRVRLAKELSFAPNRERDAGALKGRQVHEIAQQLAETGEWTPKPGEEHLEGYADALVDWWNRWQPQGLPANQSAASDGRILIERPVFNREFFYSGTFDLISDLEGGHGVCLVDYKAGRSGIFGETSLQLAAYRYAQVYLDDEGNEQPMPSVKQCLAVWLRPDGSHETYPIAAGPPEYRLFLYVYQIARFLAEPDLFKTEGDPPVQLVKGEAIVPPTSEEAAS